KTREGFDYKETINDNLSWALYNLKDYRAYEYHEKSTLIRDSLRNAEIGAFLAEIEGKYNEETIKKREELKTAEEKTKRIQAQRDNLRTEGINNILIIISLSLLLAAWLIYRYLKLRQSNLSLELKQNQLIQQNKLEQLQNDAREKILNATIDGKESERKMIAETLHNSVSTLLSSASLHLQASKMLLKDNLPEEIEKAQRIVNEAAEKIRNLSHSLVSSVLLKFGLNYATQDLCDKYSNAALNFHCKCDGINRYESQFELKINSIIDELLNNIIKHSKASNAEIRLKEKKEKLIIAILDDGKGFDTRNGLVDKGLGLAQIEARIRKMQGEFKITSSPNEGTSVYISVPVKRVENKLLVSK
ncbi:MAG TPA: histidine kinase, partial [Lutibacter sp.]|nr:histidine kinase [Lutibacter sp.]